LTAHWLDPNVSSVRGTANGPADCGSHFSFYEHKRYAWRENRLMTRQHPDTNELTDLKIVKTVNEALAAKNFEETKDHPDFYIHYDGGGNMDLLAGSPERANSTPLSPTERTPAYGLGNGPALAPATWLKVNGEIVLHITDAESKKVIHVIYSAAPSDSVVEGTGHATMECRYIDVQAAWPAPRGVSGSPRRTILAEEGDRSLVDPQGRIPGWGGRAGCREA